MSKTDRSNWKTSLSRGKPADEPDDYWMEMTPAERMSFAWELSLSAWKIAHPDYVDEPGLLTHLVPPAWMLGSILTNDLWQRRRGWLPVLVLALLDVLGPATLAHARSSVARPPMLAR